MCGNYYYYGNDLPFHNEFVCTKQEFNDLVSQLETNFGESGIYRDYKFNYHLPPQAQPVFTQAMADNGELPLVGMECNFETAFFTTATSNRGVCKPIAYHAGKVWLDMFDSEYVININVIEFKPIDTRTDKERAIDEIMLGNIGANTRELLSIVYDKWVGE